jgi:hypothetical protein
MYRTNFYGPTTFCGLSSYLSNRFSSPSLSVPLPIKDSFSVDASTAFSDKLKLSLIDMQETHMLLRKELAKDGIAEPELKARLSALEQAKKFLSIIAREGQKSMENIIANFR